MTIDTKNKVINYKLRNLIITFLVLIIIAIILLSSYFNLNIFKTKKYWIVITIAILYILYIIHNFIKDYNYIYFSDEKEKIILRYFTLSMFFENKNSIEIPKKYFSGFSINKKFYGMKEYLILYQKINNRIAIYPAVSITILSKKDKEKLISTLRKYGPEKDIKL